ncbi:MAG: DeoR/GlpR family DNA-binding transcription regulator [Pseudomonadota bacterium]
MAEIVRERGRAKVDDLARLFGVSTQTVRKDVNAMCERGLLRRVHGGVELGGANADHYELRRILNFEAKRRIGRAAARLIPNEAVLAASIGTTPELVVACLGQRSGLHIYSNNLHLAMTANRFHGIEATIPGGKLRKSEADIVGASAVSFFDSYKYDIGLFGVAAVDEAGGLLDLSDDDVESRKAISRNAAKRILVLDASKFGRSAHVRSGDVADVDHVICDARPPEPIYARLLAAGVDVVICDEASI